MPVLTVAVRFHDGRFHGAGDWPPAPARLFQALVAAAARGDQIPQTDRDALDWLATLEPPTILAPIKSEGQAVRNYVPNNDLDSVGGDPNRAAAIKTTKLIRPRLFDTEQPLTYSWVFPDTAEDHHRAQAVCAVADRLYQLGRGVDMAWAHASISETAANDDTPNDQNRYAPSTAAGGTTLACPTRDSLRSLQARHLAFRRRLEIDLKQNAIVFAQPPKPRFRPVHYNTPPRILLYELYFNDDRRFAPQRLRDSHALVTAVRDAAAERLCRALPALAPLVDLILVGRKAADHDKLARIQILPVPSTGHPNADMAIRRILIVIPPDCPLPQDDVSWAFAGVSILGSRLVAAQDLMMLNHLGIAELAPATRLWHTLTPAALPFAPVAAHANGRERAARDARLASAVAQALRHAGIAARPRSVRVQREPFHAHGDRADAFAAPPRFPAPRLWHVEVEFERPVEGPIVIGNGRYLGLGLMAPAVMQRDHSVVCYRLRAPQPLTDAVRPLLLRAVRRALMSLSKDPAGRLPKLISGHEDDGAPDRSASHDHIYLAAFAENGSEELDSILVAAPWATQTSRPPRREDVQLFDRITTALAVVRAGALGVIRLGPPEPMAEGHPLIGPACTWESHTPYLPTRHPRRNQDPRIFVTDDILAECQRRKLPKPTIEIIRINQGPRGGLQARLRLRFAVAIKGPLFLGRDSHAGGGLFLISSL